MLEERIEDSDTVSEDEDEGGTSEKLTTNLVGTKLGDDRPMALLSLVRCAVVHDVLKEAAKDKIAKIRSVVKSLKSSRYRRIGKLKLNVSSHSMASSMEYVV